jgi:enamine deaminase RidA (YjgF/YER057c/UK114 family)
MIGRDASPQFLHPPHWKRAKGYANGVVAEGRTVFVAGQIGWNAAQKFESEDFVAQVRRALENVVAVVHEAGGTPAHVTRLTWYITDKKEYLSRLAEVGEAYRSVMGRHFPAMTVVQVTGLMEDQARVEIEACAVLPEAEPARPIR